jgi:hypothetical protein
MKPRTGAQGVSTFLFGFQRRRTSSAIRRLIRDPYPHIRARSRESLLIPAPNIATILTRPLDE